MTLALSFTSAPKATFGSRPTARSWSTSRSETGWATELIWTVFVFLLAVAIRDILQRKHTIRHNFPIVGNLYPNVPQKASESRVCHGL